MRARSPNWHRLPAYRWRFEWVCACGSCMQMDSRAIGCGWFLNRVLPWMCSVQVALLFQFVQLHTARFVIENGQLVRAEHAQTPNVELLVCVLRASVRHAVHSPPASHTLAHTSPLLTSRTKTAGRCASSTSCLGVPVKCGSVRCGCSWPFLITYARTVSSTVANMCCCAQMYCNVRVLIWGALLCGHACNVIEIDPIISTRRFPESKERIFVAA